MLLLRRRTVLLQPLLRCCYCLLLEDFDYDEDIDEPKDLRKKKIAFKEEAAEAKDFLEGLKSKYYDEIKLRPGVTQEQQKALDFFNRYNEEQEAVQAKHKDCLLYTSPSPRDRQKSRMPSSA